MIIASQDKQGSLETAMAGQYDFTIGEILSEAWERIDGYKMPYAIITSVYFLIYFGVVILIGVLFRENASRAEGLIQLSGLFMLPMGASLTMMGLSIATARPITVKQLFAYYNNKFFPLIGLQIVMTMAVVLGFVLLIIPGIYLSVALVFAIPLMLEKNLSIVDAFEASRKAVTHHWFKVLGLWLVMGVIFVISALPFGLGLFWTMPMMMAVVGVLYRRMFGISDQTDTLFV